MLRWNYHVYFREFPRNVESTNLSRDNLSRQTGRLFEGGKCSRTKGSPLVSRPRDAYHVNSCCVSWAYLLFYNKKKIRNIKDKRKRQEKQKRKKQDSGCLHADASLFIHIYLCVCIYIYIYIYICIHT